MSTNADITQAWQDGYNYAKRLHAEYGYGAARIADSAAIYMRNTYDKPDERADYDDGISAYLYLTFSKGATS